MVSNLELSVELTKRRRIINAQECKHELHVPLLRMFRAFWNAKRNYEIEVVQTPYSARCRGFGASLFNSKIIQSTQFEFRENCSFGRYKRFMLRINGYIILFKKLDNHDMPMNVSTNSALRIRNQEQGYLFDNLDDGTEPILFFGYNTTRFGEIVNPKLVYIDEDKVRWVITEKDIADNKTIAIPQPTAPTLFLRENIKKKDGTNI